MTLSASVRFLTRVVFGYGALLGGLYLSEDNPSGLFPFVLIVVGLAAIASLAAKPFAKTDFRELLGAYVLDGANSNQRLEHANHLVRFSLLVWLGIAVWIVLSLQGNVRFLQSAFQISDWVDAFRLVSSFHVLLVHLVAGLAILLAVWSAALGWFYAVLGHFRRK